MADDLVMRSVYLRPVEDTQLRQLAHELNVSKSDLIRSAIGVKLREWLEADSDEIILRDLKAGLRDPRASASPSVSANVTKRDLDRSRAAVTSREWLESEAAKEIEPDVITPRRAPAKRGATNSHGVAKSS